MNDSIHDRICLCSSAQSLMPVLHIVLPHKNRWTVSASLFYEFIYKLRFPLVNFIVQPFINDQNLVISKSFSIPDLLSEIIFVILKMPQHIRHSEITGPQSLLTRLQSKYICIINGRITLFGLEFIRIKETIQFIIRHHEKPPLSVAAIRNLSDSCNGISGNTKNSGNLPVT